MTEMGIADSEVGMADSDSEVVYVTDDLKVGDWGNTRTYLVKSL